MRVVCNGGCRNAKNQTLSADASVAAQGAEKVDMMLSERSLEQRTRYFFKGKKKKKKKKKKKTKKKK